MLITNPEHQAALDSENARHFLIRLGTMGHVGRFRLSEPLQLRRTDRVVCRTIRGIEIGIVLGPADLRNAKNIDLADGAILRRMSPEDEMLWGHLRELGKAAHHNCENWLAENGIVATLLEVEPLLDGKTLYFHFLSEVGSDVQEQLDRLVTIYEAEVRESQFSRLLEHGCGPGCGTDEAVNGCGSKSGCAVCVAKTRCTKTEQ